MTVRSGEDSTASGTDVKKQVPNAPPSKAEHSANALDKNDPEGSPQPGVSLADQLKPGKLFVCFELQRELYGGSTGAVWLAQDYSVWRHADQVALKFLPDLIVSNKIPVEELKNEIRQRLALKHPNIQRVHDLMENRGILAIQLEHVDGQSLSQLRLIKPNQIFEVGDVEKWVKELCQALEYAHKEVGIADGQIMPQNLIVDSSGNLRLKEFGIASCIAASMNRLMAVHDTGETLPYMSPQRAAGESPSIADDLYSLGATLYELLTGKPPFYTGDIRAQVDGKIAPLMMERRAELGIKGEAIPKHWEETVAACLAKDPAQRPESAIEVEKRLNISTEFLVEPPSPSIPSPHLQKPWLVIAGITLILVLVSVIAFYPFQHVTESKSGRSNSDTVPDSGSDGKENFLATATPSRAVSPKTAPEVNPTASAEAKPSPDPELNPTPSTHLSPTPAPEVTPKPSPKTIPTPSPVPVPTPARQEVAAAKGREAASPSPTPLSQNDIDATKEEVIKRINALPGITAQKKEVLIGKMNKARSMERLAVIPFDIGQTTLRRAAADELVKTFSRPEMREKLSDPTIVLVVAGYADNGGRADKNLRISQERAENISKLLKDQAGLMNAMQTIGMGATELLNSERPDQNRAVEVWMVVPL